MIFKSKLIFPELIIIFCLFASILWAAEPVIPLPEDAVKISEERNDFGPMKLSNKIYESSLDKNKLTSFYRKELKGAGWKENKDLTFIKDNNTLIIMINPSKNQAGRTSFIISTGRIPTESEISTMRKKNPDKLNFMPVYPDSEQVYLWDLSNGLMGLYETENSIKDVVFFYKSGMLKYGWSLASETPITSGAIDCPDCRKTAQGLGSIFKSDNVGMGSQTTLIFSKGANETCKITIVNVSVNMSNLTGKAPGSEGAALLPPTSSSKTTISVLYNAYKNINS